MGLTAGTAEVTITPTVGTPLLGPAQPATGVHDDLVAWALVLSDGATTVALVCLDLVGLGLGLADEIRASVQRRYPEVNALFLLCSHTHSAPFTIPWSRLGWQWIEGEGRAWRGALVARVSDAVAKAASDLRPARLSAGRAPVRIGLNRRTPTPGGVVMRPNPGGPVAPWTDVLRVDHADGSPLAVLFTCAAHPVIVHGASTLISADYPGFAAAAVRRHLGEGVVAMFAQGCGGDVNGEPLRGGFAAAAAAGRTLGDAVALAALSAEGLPEAPLRVAEARGELALQALPPVDACEGALRDAEERLAAAEARGEDETALWSLQDTVLCLSDLAVKARRGTRLTLPFCASALCVGDAWCLAAMAHEVFSDYQIWLDERSPFRHTMAAAYANGCESYVPTDEALRQGGYEAAAFPTAGAALRYPYRTPLAPGAEARVKETLASLLRWAGRQVPAPGAAKESLAGRPDVGDRGRPCREGTR